MSTWSRGEEAWQRVQAGTSESPFHVSRESVRELGHQGWITIHDLVDLEDYDEFDRRQFVERSVKAYKKGDPLARGLIDTWVSHTAGGDIRFRFGTDKEQRIWDQFERENHFQHKIQVLQRKRYLEGISFPRFFGPPASDNSGQPPRVRIIPYEWIKDIDTDPEDFETIRGLRLTVPANNGGSKNRRVPSGDTVPFKHDPLGSSKFGWPILAPVLGDLAKFEKFVKTRHVLNAIRAAIPLVLRADGATQDEVNQLMTNMGWNKIPSPGSFLGIANAEIDFPDLNLDSSDAKEDADVLLMRISSAMQLEMRVLKMFMDSSRVRQSVDPNSPMIKNFEMQRTLLKGDLDRFVRRVMGPDTEFDILLSPLTKGSLQSDAQGLANLGNSGYLSPHTINHELGFDWEEEKQLLDQASQSAAQATQSDESVSWSVNEERVREIAEEILQESSLNGSY